MNLPPVNTPIQHDGSATCPVHPETLVTINGVGIRKDAGPHSAGTLDWPRVTTYTIIARAPDDRIKELEDALENLLIAIGMGWDLGGVCEIARAALKGTPMTAPDKSTTAFVTLAFHEKEIADCDCEIERLTKELAALKGADK